MYIEAEGLSSILSEAFLNWRVVTLQCIVSAVQPNESATCMRIFLGFLSHLGHHRTLSRVPYAVQSVLISYLFYT